MSPTGLQSRCSSPRNKSEQPFRNRGWVFYEWPGRFWRAAASLRKLSRLFVCFPAGTAAFLACLRPIRGKPAGEQREEGFLFSLRQPQPPGDDYGLNQKACEAQLTFVCLTLLSFSTPSSTFSSRFEVCGNLVERDGTVPAVGFGADTRSKEEWL